MKQDKYTNTDNSNGTIADRSRLSTYDGDICDFAFCSTITVTTLMKTQNKSEHV